MKKHTKAEHDEFRRDLSLLKRGTLEWIYAQLYDPADEGLQNAIVSIFWDRYTNPLRRWPTYRTYDDPAWVLKLGKDHLVSHCQNGSGCNDAGHQPVRENPINGYIECSCGLRSRDLVQGQRHPTSAVWPIEYIDGIPHFVICSKARFADDPAHAPVNSGSPDTGDPLRCICRFPLDQERLDDLKLSLKRLPAY